MKLPLNEQDRALAYASFTRVVDTLQRCVDQGRFPGRDPVAIGLQTWGLVHGLASLELRCCLGPPADAEARWRDAVDAIIAGYRQVPTPNRSAAAVPVTHPMEPASGKAAVDAGGGEEPVLRGAQPKGRVRHVPAH